MLSIVTQTLRLTARRWPQLLAWFLAGWLARYLLIELAANIGATFSLGGLLIMPLAILARLVSFVAMFLVLRDDMPNLRSAAESMPRTRGEKRRAFLDAVLISILPFFAFYYAWGLLRNDMAEYSRRALDIYTFFRGDFLDPERISYTEIDTLQFDALTISIIVVAFAGRWALKRWSSRVPRWTSLVGVYLEAVWVFMTVYLLGDFIGAATGWVRSRQAMLWLDGIREWIASVAAPLGWIGDAIAWVLGEAGGIILQPIAWLTLAGVVYGRTIAARAVELPAHATVDGVRRRWRSLPAPVRRSAGDLGQELTSRFRPVSSALVTIWRAGALPMGVFILTYAVIGALYGGAWWGITRLLGPHELNSFWMLIDGLVLLAALALTEPLRIALVAAAYDFALTRLSIQEIRELEEPVEDAAGVAPAEAGIDQDPTSRSGPTSNST